MRIKSTRVDFILIREICMPGIREVKKRKKRNAIMEAAVRLFSEKGFEKTSIEQLARTAGIGKGTIYSYFQTKRRFSTLTVKMSLILYTVNCYQRQTRRPH
jgi:AcrR family transcriptional regulator